MNFRIDGASIGLMMAVAFAAPASSQVVTTVVQNGDSSELYDIVVLGDGYQASEQAQFDLDVQRVVSSMQSNFPHDAYFGLYNIHSVFRASNESGADDPAASVMVDTAYDATYGVGGIQRCLYLGTSAGEAQATADAALAPDTDGRVIVLVNDSQYGGCAGLFAVSYAGTFMEDVQIHEWGHSFAELADEYDTGQSGTYSGPEFAQVNVTNSPTGNRWVAWLGSVGVNSVVGAYEGARYYMTGVWRPELDCMMRSLGRPLCSVCREQSIKRFHQECVVFAEASPNPAGTVGFVGESITFSFIDRIASRPHSIEWSVDGGAFQPGSATFVWDTSAVAAGSHAVEARLTDLSTEVRSDPFGDLVQTQRWDVLLEDPGLIGSFESRGAACPAAAPIALDGFGRPAIGGSYPIELSGLPGDAFGSSLIVGLSPADIDLGFLGADGCSLLSSGDLGALPMGPNIGGTSSLSLPLPDLPALLGLTLELQGASIAPSFNTFGVATSEARTLVVGQPAPRASVEARGENTFNSDESVGFFRVVNYNGSGLDVVSVQMSFFGSSVPGIASGLFDTDQADMDGRFDGGRGATCGSTIRADSDLTTGLVYDVTPLSSCDPTARVGWTGGPPGASIQTIRFEFDDFEPGETFEFDVDTDGGPGVAGGDLAGLVVTVEFSDGVIEVRELAAQSPTWSRVMF